MNNTLAVFDPVDTLRSFAEGTIWDDPFWTAPRYRRKNDQHSTADLVEYEDRYQLTMDLPGVNREDINISVEDDRYLTISARRQNETSNEKGRTITQAKRNESFRYSINIDKAVKVDEIEAELENGVLRLNMPKPEQELNRVRKIEIT